MKTLDLTGLKCPMPLIETKKALKDLGADSTLKIIIDNETSAKNVTHYLSDHEVPVNQTLRDGLFELLVSVPEKAELEGTDPASYCEPEKKETGFVIFFSKDRIGDGSDELGHALAGAMLNTLIASSRIPKSIIFMNSGINLALNGSLFLPQLKQLSENGTDIVACGTCLDYFGKMDELAVGRVSNMHDILETLLSTTGVINI